MALPKAVVFDLDKTLSESKLPVTAEMGVRLERLLLRVPVAITSGQKLSQLESQAADFVSETARKNLYLLPTSGAAMYHFLEGKWESVYKESLLPEEAREVIRITEGAIQEAGILEKRDPSWGSILEHRDSSVAASILGQAAPLEAKKVWDPDQAIRVRLREILMPLLPEYEIRIAGTTTIDINRKGIDKAYGVRQLSEYLKIPLTEMLYVGDDLGPGGNDEVVIATGIPTHAVRNPDDTATFIDSLLASGA